MGLGLKEILVIGVALMVFFGPSKLPELGKSLGQGIREFKKAKDELMSQAEAARK
jgi:sec-independent protein translocase protein TatA